MNRIGGLDIIMEEENEGNFQNRVNNNNFVWIILKIP